MTRYDLTCKFFRLPDTKRREIIEAFQLLKPEDHGRSSIDKYRRAFCRADERGILDALFERIASECQGTHSHYCRGYHLERRKDVSKRHKPVRKAVPVSKPAKEAAYQVQSEQTEEAVNMGVRGGANAVDAHAN